jgi:hypothetical protein
MIFLSGSISSLIGPHLHPQESSHLIHLPSLNYTPKGETAFFYLIQLLTSKYDSKMGKSSKSNFQKQVYFLT